MTLFEIIDIFKKTALVQPNIRSASDGSVYDKLNTNPSIQYDVFHIQQTTHQEDFETDYYGLQLFYISRLEDSLEDNRLQIQSIGKEILGNIIRTFCENFGIDYPIITYTPFTQRFNDLTAGVYCNVRLEVPKEIWCADDYIAEVVPGKEIKLQDMGITITQNGLIVITPDAEYDGIGEIRIETNVPQYPAELQYKEVEYTENGSYSIHPDPDYDGLSSVSVDVDVPDRYDEGYDDGKEDGIAEQKGKLTATTFTENNTYTIENGWSAVTVNVPSDYQEGYDEGKADGIAEQKAKLVPTAVTENGTYARADGYSSFEVNVPQGQGYDEGYADGEAAQKAKLTSLSVSANGEYNREDGYSAITVNVPSDYQEGYDDGFDDGEATQKAKLTTLSVSANGEYTRADGYSAITVNVPQTGSSNEDLIANLQGDYYVIPYGTTHLRRNAFYQAPGLTSITIPNTVRYIDTNAFQGVAIKEITLPDSVTGISGAFQNAQLETIHFGSGLTDLGAFTFQGCKNMKDITIPETITRFGSGTFKNCSGLTAMTFEGVTPPLLGNTSGTNASLGDTAYTFPIYVPCQSLDAYKTAFGEYYAPRIACVSPGPEPPEPSLNEPLTMHITQDGNISWKTNDADFATTIQYKKNDGEWTNITATTGGTLIPVVSGDTVWFRGDNQQYTLGTPLNTQPRNTFEGTTAGFELWNNIMSLIDSTNFQNIEVLTSSCTFASLFLLCTGLTEAENLLLPATSLTEYCYASLFDRCRNLSSSPKYLPATSLAKGCYEEMFWQCLSLETVPSILPATTLKPYCYSWMFYQTNITVAPELPARTLAEYCYLDMFQGCTRLSSIKCLATNISAERCTTSWVNGVSSSGTFIKAAGMSSWTRGTDGVPTNWAITDNT